MWRTQKTPLATISSSFIKSDQSLSWVHQCSPYFQPPRGCRSQSRLPEASLSRPLLAARGLFCLGPTRALQDAAGSPSLPTIPAKVPLGSPAPLTCHTPGQDSKIPLNHISEAIPLYSYWNEGRGLTPSHSPVSGGRANGISIFTLRPGTLDPPSTPDGPLTQGSVLAPNPIPAGSPALTSQ